MQYVFIVERELKDTIVFVVVFFPIFFQNARIQLLSNK